MSSFVIICHGGRGAGTSAGTYVVPKGVKIHFFTEDGVNMNAAGGKVLIAALLEEHASDIKVQQLAKEYDIDIDTKGQYETIPNYNAAPARGNEFPVATGVYKLGQENPPHELIHVRKRLSEIIGGCSSGGVLGNNIYWLSCRAVKPNSNNFDKETVSNIDGKELGKIKVARAMGKPPSAVKARGEWQ